MDIRRGAGHYFGQASDSALDSRGRGAAYLDRSALRRLLELETKRCRGDCPQLCRTRFSFWLSADRLGRRVRGVRGNRVSHSTFSRGDLLQICRYSRMDWSQPVRDFLRYLSPIFLFARARDLLRHCCDLGYVFLRFFATEHLCRDRRLTFGRVVLACASNRRKILSVSFLWCRWSSTGKFFVVLGYRATNCDVESDTDSRNPSANRFVRSAAGKIRLLLCLVAGCHGSVCSSRRLRQSPSLVPATPCAHHRCVCRRLLRVF